MSKLKALLVAVIPIALLVIGGVYFYSQFPTTPALILLLLFAFSAVLLGITLYNNVLEREETKDIPSFEWSNIKIEGNLLPIFPDEFFANPQVTDGTLWAFGENVAEGRLTYQKGSINKLSNESIFSFTQGYSVVAKALHLIHVGDFQFSISSFDNLIIKKNSQELISLSKKGNIISVQKNDTITTFKIETSTPLLVFVFDEQKD